MTVAADDGPSGWPALAHAGMAHAGRPLVAVDDDQGTAGQCDLALQRQVGKAGLIIRRPVPGRVVITGNREHRRAFMFERGKDVVTTHVAGVHNPVTPRGHIGHAWIQVAMGVRDQGDGDRVTADHDGVSGRGA